MECKFMLARLEMPVLFEAVGIIAENVHGHQKEVIAVQTIPHKHTPKTSRGLAL